MSAINMKFEVLKDNLEQAVFRAEKITGKNLSLSVLGCILFIAKGKKLKVRATNLDIGIDIEVPSKITKEGTAAVPGSAISTLISNIQGEKNLKVELSGNNLLITTQKSNTQIRTQPQEDFPTLPAVSSGSMTSVSAQDVAQGLKSVWYSASLSSMKPELSSVFVGYDNGTMTFAATDSFRLAEKKVSAKKSTQEFKSLLIPIKNVSEIIRNLELISGAVKLAFNENQLSMTLDDGTFITSRIVDGIFPDYKQILPSSFDSEVTVLKQDLANALKLSNIFSNKFNQILMRVTPSKKSFVVETHNPELGENTTTMDAAISGDDLEIGFNYKYITDSFQSISSDSISLQFSGPGKPMVVRGVGDNTFTYLVMPMNR